MSTYKPALLNCGERPRLRDDPVLIPQVANIPDIGSKVVPLLINGKGVIAVQDMDMVICPEL